MLVSVRELGGTEGPAYRTGDSGVARTTSRGLSNKYVVLTSVHCQAKPGNGRDIYSKAMTDFDAEGEAPTDEKEGTFVLTHVEAESAIISDVSNAQVHTLSENPGVVEGEVLEATVAPDPPMGVTFSVVEVAEQKTIPIEESDEPPTQQEVELAAGLDEGGLATTERAGIGEIHVLSVPESATAGAVSDVLEDQATVERAARLGVNRVEIRADAGVVAVRYLP